jgi:phytol kinase
MPQAMAGMIVILAAGVGMLAGLNAYHVRRPQNPEVARKLLHIAIGLLALTLPWVFDSVWPVILLVGAGMIILCGIRLSCFLRRYLGGSIDGVDRNSYGDLCFLLAIILLFVAARDRTVLYYVPIAILTFADSGAALVGIPHGRRSYPALGGIKSIEGSAVFFTIALLCAGALLPAFSEQGAFETFFMATALALATTFLEGLSGKGFDNLTIPVGAFFLLQAMAGPV